MHTTTGGNFQAYAPHLYRELRSHYGFSEELYVSELEQKVQAVTDHSGRSGSDVWISANNLFVIKSIPYQEGKLLRDIVGRYYMHMKSQPHSLLVRILGLYRVHLSGQKKIRLIVMDNIFNTDKYLHLKFDLKGSKVGRDVKWNGPGDMSVLKDVNFDNMLGTLKVGLSQKNAIMRQLRQDVMFLARLDVMDESLLLGYHQSGWDEQHCTFALDAEANLELSNARPIQIDMLEGPLFVRPATHPDAGKNGLMSAFEMNYGGVLSFTQSVDQNGQVTVAPQSELYFLGIVDILQQYTVKKKMETTLKGLRFAAEKVSSIATSKYADRIVKYVDSITE
jgi:1-phosphatidylinositol-4-phosphate 5-kinase